MQSLSENDIKYIIAINASEESILYEIPFDFDKWQYNKCEVLDSLSWLIKNDIILFSKPVNDKFLDLTKDESLQLCLKWESLKRRDIIIFFTEIGEGLWKNDDWGISKKRAELLLFKESK